MLTYKELNNSIKRHISEYYELNPIIKESTIYEDDILVRDYGDMYEVYKVCSVLSLNDIQIIAIIEYDLTFGRIIDGSEYMLVTNIILDMLNYKRISFDDE